MSELNPDPLDPRHNDPESAFWQEGGRIHNWQNYIGANVKAIWSDLSDEVKKAIALDADQESSLEEWD